MDFTALDICLAVVLAVAAATDLRTGLIYNALTYPAILAGLGAALCGLGPSPAASLAGCLVGGGVLYLVFVNGWMGGGDVKLMAAVGAFTGMPVVLSALFYSLFFGGVYSALAVIWRRNRQPLSNTFPFGVAIALGTTVAVALARSA